MTVADFLLLIRRGWRVLLVCVLVGLIAAAGWYVTAPRVYLASASGFIAPGGSQAVSGSETAVLRAKSYLPLINSSAVIDRIKNDPKVNPDGSPLAGRLDATVASGSSMIVVTASASNPESALALANGALSALAAVVSEIEKKTNPGEAPALVVVPIENASLPTVPASPNPRLIFAIGFVAGLAVGLLVLFIRRALDVRVRHAEEASQALGTGVLGWLPKLPGRSRGTRVIGPNDVLAAESVRQIRTGLRFSSVDREVRSFVVTSANQGEGKSTVTAAIAAAFAESGQPTVVVDADLRRPALSEVLGAGREVGLSEVLSGQVRAADALRTTETDRLLLLPAGRRPPNPSEMVGSKAFHQLVVNLAEDHLVIVDAPPVLPVTDAALASTGVDGVVFVVAARRTKRPELVASKQILDRVRAPMLGLVLNMTRPSDGDLNHYSYYTKKYHKRGRATAPDPAPVVFEQADVTHRPADQVATTAPGAAGARPELIPLASDPASVPATDPASPAAPASDTGESTPAATGAGAAEAGSHPATQPAPSQPTSSQPAPSKPAADPATPAPAGAADPAPAAPAASRVAGYEPAGNGTAAHGTAAPGGTAHRTTSAGGTSAVTGPRTTRLEDDPEATQVSQLRLGGAVERVSDPRGPRRAR